MVIKSLKTKIFSGLLACLFLMPISLVSTMYADGTVQAAAELTIKAGQAGAQAVQTISPDWQMTSAAWGHTAAQGRELIGTGCKLFKELFVSNIGHNASIFAADVFTGVFNTGTVWLNFWRKHPYALAGIVAGAASYSVYHKLYYGKWWPKIIH